MQGSIQAKSLKEQKFYTIMEGVPDDLNREQILSLTSHISRVVSLVIIKVHTRANKVHRVGIVEVADCESIFRLTSRQFLVGPGKIIKFRIISPESKLVKVGLEHHISLKATYSSSDRSVFSSVVELIGRHGEANLVSMKGQSGLHELMFRVPQNYSLREISTNLSINVSGCHVKLDYPETDYAIDYFQPELAFLDAKDPYAHLKAQPLVSEEARFFYPSPEPVQPRAQAQKVEIWKNTYHIHDDELSEEEDNLDDDFQEASDRRHLPEPSGQSAGLQFFNNTSISSFMQNRGALIKPAGHMSPTGAASHSFVGPLPARLHVSAPADRRLADEGHPKSAAPVPTASNQPLEKASASSELLKKKKAKKPRKKKTGESRAAEEAGTPGTTSAPTSEPLKSAEVGAEETGTARNSTPSTEEQPLSDRDGSKLLDLLCPPCSDFKELNEKLMPEVMDKWRRFAEIKNEMRKERYLEYLQAKKKEAEQQDTSAVDPT